jgi:hypothetical protein
MPSRLRTEKKPFVRNISGCSDKEILLEFNTRKFYKIPFFYRPLFVRPLIRVKPFSTNKNPSLRESLWSFIEVSPLLDRTIQDPLAVLHKTLCLNEPLPVL